MIHELDYNNKELIKRINEFLEVNDSDYMQSIEWNKIRNEEERNYQDNIDELLITENVVEYLDDLEDNFVSFSLWSSFGSSCSLVYCEEGIPKIEHDGENYVVPLSMKNWYYHTNVSDR